MAAPYRGVLFDLFGTLVAFDAGRLPELEVDGVRHRTTVGGLAPALAEWVPGVSLADFAHALLAVSVELARGWAVDHVELPSRERFRRALARVGCAPGVLSHPAVARAGLRGLRLAAGEVLLVGDTYAEDVAGAHAAGLDAAWIDARGQGVPDGAAPPRYLLRALPELAALL